MIPGVDLKALTQPVSLEDGTEGKKRYYNSLANQFGEHFATMVINQIDQQATFNLKDYATNTK